MVLVVIRWQSEPATGFGARVQSEHSHQPFASSASTASAMAHTNLNADPRARVRELIETHSYGGWDKAWLRVPAVASLG